ncbi:MAG: hypothetical protein R6V30_13560 [Paracoccaceae bacterium]
MRVSSLFIAAVILAGCNAQTGETSQPGPDIPMIYAQDIGLTPNETNMQTSTTVCGNIFGLAIGRGGAITTLADGRRGPRPWYATQEQIDCVLANGLAIRNVNMDN